MAISNYCISMAIVVLLTYTMSKAWSVCGPQHFIQKENLDNRTSEDILLWEQTLNKRGECAAECSRDDRCVVIQYSTELSMCRAYPVGSKVLEDLPWTEAPGYKTFILEERDLGIWGSACADNSNCPFPSAECHSSQCRCRIGYSFNPKTSTCGESCTTYGQYYSVYTERNIQGYDYLFQTVNSMTVCMNLCNQHESCLSLDYSQTSCYLKQHSWLQVPEENYGYSVWSHAQKQCRN